MDELVIESFDAVRRITLNRPEARNAFTNAMRTGLAEALEGFANDAGVRCVVVTGADPAFSAGGDVASMAELQDRGDTAEIADRIAVARRALLAIRSMPKPVVAAVNGAAAGGGMNLALACDLRFASERAFFSESFVKIGLVPDWGGFFTLPRLVGSARALELMWSGGRVDAERARSWGLLNEVFPAEGFQEEVLRIAGELAAGPPEAIGRIKEGVYRGLDGVLTDALDFEAEAQASLFLSRDAREGMRAFVEKRAPRFGS